MEKGMENDDVKKKISGGHYLTSLQQIGYLRENKLDYLLRQPQVRAVLNAHAVDSDDIEFVQDANEYLKILCKQEYIVNDFYSCYYPTQEEIGEFDPHFHIPLSYVEKTKTLLFRPIVKFPGGVIIVGPPETGKTVLLFNIIYYGAGKVTIIAIDTGKTELNRIAKIPSLKQYVRVFAGEDLKLSDLQPAPGQSEQSNRNLIIKKVGDIYELEASLRLAVLSHKDMKKNLVGQDNYGSWKQWLKKIENTKSGPRTAGYKEALSHVIESEMLDNIGSILNYKYSEQMEEILRPGTINIIELYSLLPRNQLYLISRFKDYVYAKRLFSKTRDFEVLLFIIDDFSTLEDESKSSADIIGSEIRLERWLKISTILACHNLFSLGEITRHNCHTTICTSSWGDIDSKIWQSVFGLSSEKQVNELKKLDIDETVTLTKGIWNYPVRGKVIPSDEVKKIMESDVIFSAEERKALMEPLLKQIKAIPDDESNENIKISTSISKEELSAVQKKILHYIYCLRFVSEKEIYQALDLPASSCNRNIQSLEDKSFIKIHYINWGVKGGMRKHFELKSSAYELLGISPEPGLGRGTGFCHDLWVHYLIKKFKQMDGKYEVLGPEENRNGKFVDFVIKFNSLIIAIEVESENSLEQIRKNIEDDIKIYQSDFVIEACISEKDVNEVEQIARSLGKSICDKVVVCLCHSLFHCNELEEILKLTVTSQGSNNKQL